MRYWLYLRSILTALVTVVLAECAFGQGTVNFANLVIVDGVRIVDAPVRDTGGTLLSGSMFAAQLYFGSGGGTPVGLPTTFLPGAGAGYFSGGVRTIDFVQPGQFAVVQVKAWNLASGATYEAASDGGASALVQIQTGGLNGAPPANLIGLQPFCFVTIGGTLCIPEPSTWLLFSLGGLALFCCRWRRN
jgi:hypothetical protein